MSVMCHAATVGSASQVAGIKTVAGARDAPRPHHPKPASPCGYCSSNVRKISLDLSKRKAAAQQTSEMEICMVAGGDQQGDLYLVYLCHVSLRLYYLIMVMMSLYF
jgi:hypothetical protein